MSEDNKVEQFVDMLDVHVVSFLQKDLQLLQTQAQVLLHKLEIAKMQLAAKYNLGPNDTIDQDTGKVTRK